MLHLFQEAVEHYGLPLRVWCDAGGENVLASQYMLSHSMRAPGRGSIIVGKSVHNQSVKRLWRDVYQGVLGLYHDIFGHIEELNMLHPDSDVDFLTPSCIPTCTTHQRTLELLERIMDQTFNPF